MQHVLMILPELSFAQYKFSEDLHRDMELEYPVVTAAGIMKDDQAECQTLLGRLEVEIDLHLEMLDEIKGVKMPDRSINNTEYNRMFDDAARRLYKTITGSDFPRSVEVM